MTETAAPGPAELYAALAAVQAELPEVKKLRTAKVEKDGRVIYTYEYADLADVSAAVMPVLGRHGLAFTAFPGHSDGKFGLRYSLLHASGASLDGFYEISDAGGMQVTGGRITYARRYCLCAVTGVAAEEDVDARGDIQQAPQRAAQRRARPQAAPPARPEPSLPARREAPPRAGGAPPLPGEPGYDAPAAAAGQDAASRGLVGVIQGHLERLGVTERDAKLRVISRLTRRPVGSSKELTAGEGRKVAGTLEGLREGAHLAALLDDIAIEEASLDAGPAGEGENGGQ